MHPIGQLLNVPSFFSEIYNFSVIKSILIYIFIFTIASFLWFQFFKKLIKLKDGLSIVAFACVAFQSILVGLLNIFHHYLSLSTSLIVAFLVVIGIALIGKFFLPKNEERTEFDKSSILICAVILIFSTIALMPTAGIDFGRFHFGMSAAYLNGSELGEYMYHYRNPYHYGSNLLTAAYADFFSIDAWVSEDLLPLSLCWTPFVFLRLVTLSVFNCKKALFISVLAFFGTNIRLFFVIGVMAFSFITSNNLESLKHNFYLSNLITSNMNLELRTWLTSFEQILHPGSNLGIPIYIGIIALYVTKLSYQSFLLLCFMLLFSMPLHREALFLSACLLVLVKTFKENEIKNKLFYFLSIILIVISAFFGGVLGNKVIKAVESNVPISFSESQSLISKEKTYNLGTKLRIAPKLVTLNVKNALNYVNLYNPQLVLDLLLDFSIALIGILFIPYFLWKKREHRFVFVISILIPLIVILFVEMPPSNYKLDLFRVLPYNLLVLYLLICLFSYIKIQFQLKFIFLLSLTGAVSLLIFSSKQNYTWNWYSKEAFEIAEYIKQQPSFNINTKVYGMNPGYVGVKKMVSPGNAPFYNLEKVKRERVLKLANDKDIWVIQSKEFRDDFQDRMMLKYSSKNYDCYLLLKDSL